MQLSISNHRLVCETQVHDKDGASWAGTVCMLTSVPICVQSCTKTLNGEAAGCVIWLLALLRLPHTCLVYSHLQALIHSLHCKILWKCRHMSDMFIRYQGWSAELQDKKLLRHLIATSNHQNHQSGAAAAPADDCLEGGTRCRHEDASEHSLCRAHVSDLNL